MNVRTKTFLINSSNYVNGSIGVYRYNFGSYNLNLQNSAVAVTSCSIYNSLFNIRADWGNNKIVIFFDNLIVNNVPNSYEHGTGYTDPVNGTYLYKKYVVIVINDGYYSISDLNAVLQMHYNNLGLCLYYTNGSATTYFSEFDTDPNQYKSLVTISPIPSAITSAQALKLNINNVPGMTLPSTNQSFFMYFPASSSFYKGIGAIFGFPDSTFFPFTPHSSSVGVGKTTQITSSLTPNLSPISTYIFTCNMVQNSHTIPNNLFFQLPITASLGSLIVFNQYPIYITALESSFSFIEIKLFDQFNNPLNINDNEMCLTLAIQTHII